MSSAVVIGHGYMGKLIIEELKIVGIDDICTIDINLQTNKHHKWFRKYDEYLTSDCFNMHAYCFIASPAKTHFDYIKKAINSGCGNIFVEKPSVMSKKEFKLVKKMIAEAKHEVKIVTGYILRQSTALSEALKVMNDLILKGYSLDYCNVVYQKMKVNHTRSLFDIGVFEEYFHVIELLNNSLFREDVLTLLDAESSISSSEKHLEINSQYQTSTLRKINVFSSFLKVEKKRHFDIVFKNGSLSARVCLKFDEANSDILEVEQADELTRKSYPSNKKLNDQVISVIKYFEGKPACPSLHLFEQSEEVTCHFDELLNKIAIEKEARKLCKSA